MLPLFHIITEDTQYKMSSSTIPTKPKRKKNPLEVPVHKSDGKIHDDRHHQTGSNNKVKKTYSANFNANSKNGATEIVLDMPDMPERISSRKKVLYKEITRLKNENEELVSKFDELEELSVKKITKLREKISQLQSVNLEFSKENVNLKEYCQNLAGNFEELQTQVELSKFCKNCEQLSENIDKFNVENENLKSKNHELNEDINMLKTVVYRLNVQLERYQQKLRESNIKVPKSIEPMFSSTQELHINDPQSGSHQNHGHDPISWGSVNSHTLGPLLDAYQDTIAEKDEIIENYEIEMSKFTGKLKSIVEENENLYRMLTEDTGCSAKLKLELEKMKADLERVKEQNDVLIKKCAVKQDKIEEILKIYENKVEQLRRDYNLVHEEYMKARTEIAGLKEKNKTLIDAHEDFKNERHEYIPVSVHNASVQECKKWYEELKVQYEHEKSKLKDQVEIKERLVDEMKEKLNVSHKLKEELETKIVQMEKHLKKAEARNLDLEHQLNETRLAKSACKRQLHKAMTFAGDMVKEQETLLKALDERQLENRAVKKIGADMASRMDALKNQLKDVQRSAWQEFSSVEERIHKQEDEIDRLKTEHEKEIDRLQNVIKEHQQLVENVQVQAVLPKSPHVLFKDKYSNK